jgi:hypothetical protein
MLLLGFAGLGYAGYRQAKASALAWLASSIDWLTSGGSRVCRSGRTFGLLTYWPPRLIPGRGFFFAAAASTIRAAAFAEQCVAKGVIAMGRLGGPSPACWMRRSATIEPSKPAGRATIGPCSPMLVQTEGEHRCSIVDIF